MLILSLFNSLDFVCTRIKGELNDSPFSVVNSRQDFLWVIGAADNKTDWDKCD